MAYSKYRAKRVRDQETGIWFDSMMEYRRWQELVMLCWSGAIHSLEEHPEFVIWPSIKYTETGRKRPRSMGKRTFAADFRYYDVELGEIVVEDVKGVRTAAFNKNLHWWLLTYPGQLFRLTTSNGTFDYRGLAITEDA